MRNLLGMLSGLFGPKQAEAPTTEPKAETAAQAPTQINPAQVEAQRQAMSQLSQATPAAVAQSSPVVAHGPVLEQVGKLLSTILPQDAVTKIMNFITQFLPAPVTQAPSQTAPTAPQSNNEAAEFEKAITSMLSDPKLVEMLMKEGASEASKPTAQTNPTPQAAATQTPVAPTGNDAAMLEGLMKMLAPQQTASTQTTIPTTAKSVA